MCLPAEQADAQAFGRTPCWPWMGATSRLTACKPVRDSVPGQRIDGSDDIRRIGDLVRAQSLDLLQADHTLSGIDIALWDLVGRQHCFTYFAGGIHW